MANNAQPPKPPKTKHQITFYPYQVFGMIVIVLIPILALCGLFGTTSSIKSTASEALSLEVEYPSKFRYKTIEPIEIVIENISAESQDVSVSINKNYVSQFSNVQFSPSPDLISESNYQFDLGSVSPGETRTVAGEIQSEKYGKFRGSVQARAGGTTTEIAFTTISLP